MRSRSDEERGREREIGERFQNLNIPLDGEEENVNERANASVEREKKQRSARDIEKEKSAPSASPLSPCYYYVSSLSCFLCECVSC
jgi:hypothetical protein